MANSAAEGQRAPFQRWIDVAVIVAFAGVALRLALFIHERAVNVLFWDQWDYLQPEFDGSSVWTEFLRQHGPHRQGLGGVLLRAIHSVNSWDARWDAAASATMMLLAAALAVLAVRQLTGRLTIFDIAIPALFGTLQAYEIYIGTPNPAHSPIPAALICGFVLALLIRDPNRRTPVLLAINFFAIYTGFALFLGLITPALFLVWLWGEWKERKARIRNAVGVLVTVASLASFKIGYVFSPAVECFKFPDPHPFSYLKFIALVLIRPLGAIGPRGARLPLGYFVLLCLLGAMIWGVVRFVRSRGTDSAGGVVLVLTSFTLLFAANSAVGRVCTGIDEGSVSRYVPFGLLGLLGIYCYARAAPMNERLRRLFLGALCLTFLVKDAFGRDTNEHNIEWYSGGKRVWTACYLRTGDAEQCNREADFLIYPNAAAITQRLAFLKAHHLSLFKDQ